MPTPGNLEMKVEDRMNLKEMNIEDLGRKEYQEVLALQEKLREQRMHEEIPDTVLLVEHPSVYTLGKDLVAEDQLIKETLSAPLFRVNRGGKITYHGPGQLVGYFIFKMPLRKIGNFVDTVEELTLSVARNWGVSAYSRKTERDSYGKNIRGTWCLFQGEHKKIAAQGIETKSAGLDSAGQREIVTMHGFALNVSTDLSYFRNINACGFPYPVMTSMQEVLGTKKAPCYEEVKEYCKSILPSFFASFSHQHRR